MFALCVCYPSVCSISVHARMFVITADRKCTYLVIVGFNFKDTKNR